MFADASRFEVVIGGNDTSIFMNIIVRDGASASVCLAEADLIFLRPIPWLRDCAFLPF
jgi:hypothetical protein